MSCRNITLVLALALTLLAPALAEPVRATTPQGWATLEGGIGRAEIDAMRAERSKYSLWVVTATRGSGAFLADVHLRILDAQRQPVFEHVLQAPWLLIDLPVGRYELEGTYEGQVQRQPTTIHAGDHHQVVLRFQAEGDVLPKGEQQ